MMKNTLRILGVLMLLGATTFAGTISITNANFSDVTANGCGMGYVYQVGVGSAPCNLLPYPQQNLNGVSGIGWTFGQPPEGGGGDGLATGNSAFNPPQSSKRRQYFSVALRFYCGPEVHSGLLSRRARGNGQSDGGSSDN